MPSNLAFEPTPRRPTHPFRLALWVSLTLVAFAGNSLLCRLALKHTAVDPASFTAARLLSGALMLWLVLGLRNLAAPPLTRQPGKLLGGNWWSAAALFAYAALLSYAFVSLSTATGALLQFGAVQVTMIGAGLWRGERLGSRQWAGLGLALPGLTTPSLGASLTMLAAGAAWGVYSLRGRATVSSTSPSAPANSAPNATRLTASNFLRTLPMAAMWLAATSASLSLDARGLAYAVVSGALMSSLGYALWYQVLPALKATQAATVQLAVPVIAALGAVALLGEPLTATGVLASAAILGGVALVVRP